MPQEEAGPKKHNYKQIADVLGITERTIKAHHAQLMQKMGVQSAVQLGRAVEWLGEFFQAAPALDMAQGQSK
ncbi:MAG: helix-turn-helix transcriptional regulator [Verrucomicrobia bacterium]|nr:helix-turn-helix transcriptional regulator [Verrucomicrobiota bacterium]